MWSDPSDLTPELLTQNPDSSNQKDALSGRKRPALKILDISTTLTDILDGTSVPTALNYVVRLNGTVNPGMLPSLLQWAQAGFVNYSDRLK
jgi:hypothetical protein